MVKYVADILERQRPDGSWGGVAWNRGFDSTLHALMLLRELGLDPTSGEAKRALALVRDRVTWRGAGPDECDTNRFFEGEIEPCINGQVALVGAYFGEDVRGIVDRLVGEQLADGGWNCDAERGSTRSSFNTTICVIEALLEYERCIRADAAVAAARRRGEEYLLDRRLMRRLSTGEVIAVDRKTAGREREYTFTEFAFPAWWHYDILRALDYFRRAGRRDSRMNDAIALVESKRIPGTDEWRVDVVFPGRMLVDLGQREGEPSPWITERAQRVLAWYSP